MLVQPVTQQALTVASIADIGEKDLIVPEEAMATLTLNDKGMIRDCSQALGKLLGCQPSNLLWQHISLLMPQLAKTTLMNTGQINPRLHFLSRIGYPFEVIGVNGTRFASELFFNVVGSIGRQQLRIIIRPAANRGADV